MAAVGEARCVSELSEHLDHHVDDNRGVYSHMGHIPGDNDGFAALVIDGSSVGASVS